MKVMGNKSFNNATSGEDLGLEIVIPLYSTIFMLAVIGNTLVIVTLLRNRRMRTVTNIFLLNLAIADLLLGVFCMPFTLVGQALQNFIFGQLMCNLIPFFQASAVSSSVWTLVAISLERYFAICKPLRSRSWQTKSHAYKSIVAIWFGSFLFCLPIGLLAELQPISETGRHKCREVWPSLLAEKSYNLLLIVLFLVLPLILMGFAYSLIVYQLKLAMKLTITEPICEADIKIRVNSCENSRSFSENKNMEHKICARNLTQNTDCASATSITKEMRCLDHIRSCPSYCCPKSQNPFLNARNSLSESPPTKKSQVENNFRGSVRKSYSDRNITAKKKIIGIASGILIALRFGIDIKEECYLVIYVEEYFTYLEVIIMLCAIVIEFFVCWMPLSVINTWVVFDANGLYQKLSPTWISLIQLLAYLSSCCNPVTYGFLNLQFRTGFLNVFGCQSNRKDPRNIPLHPPGFIASPSGKRINKKKSLFRKIYQCSSTSTQSSSEV